jgi:glyoxylase-like metal-dependent hydrolase (beta-lactamase superfamily II)
MLISARATRNQAIRPPQALADGEVLDLGGKAVRYLETPHVPHGWDAGLISEQTTRTLFVGDLFTAAGPAYRGDGPAALRELAGAYAERITSALSAERSRA